MSSLGLGVSVTVPEIIHPVTYSIYYCITHHSLKELSVASEIKPVYFQCTNLVLFFCAHSLELYTQFLNTRDNLRSMILLLEAIKLFLHFQIYILL